MKKLLLILFVLSIYISQANTESSLRSKCNALTFEKLKTVFAINNNSKSEHMLNTNKVRFPFVQKNSTVYVQLLVRVDAQPLQLYGGEVISSTKSIMAIRIPIDNLEVFMAQDAVQSVEVSQKYTKQMDESRKEIGADKVQLGTGMPKKTQWRRSNRRGVRYRYRH